MEVEESAWITKAVANIDKYLHRGGQYEGDTPQLLGGSDLRNTIGFAMGLEMKDPKEWTKKQLDQALEGKLCYYFEDAGKTVDVIHDRVVKCCGGDWNYITVLPIELYYDGKLYELPLFRAQRTLKSSCFYIDNIGRYYTSVDDWFENSKLPPCKMAYPANLKQERRPPDYACSNVMVDDTPAARVGATVVRGLDIGVSIAGILGSVGAIIFSGGLAVPFVIVGVGSALYGTGRAGSHLYDKGSHGESINPFTNSESRMLWLGLAANIISFSALGASMRLASLAARGKTISDAFRILVNVTSATSVAVNATAIIDATVYMSLHFEQLDATDILFHIASVAFWAKGCFHYKTAGTIIRDAHNTAFRFISEGLSTESAKTLQSIRSELRNDRQLLTLFSEAQKNGVDPATFARQVTDLHRNSGTLCFDSQGNLVVQGSKTSLPSVLANYGAGSKSLSADQMNDAITQMSPGELQVFSELRRSVNNDLVLVRGIATAQVERDASANDVITNFTKFWDHHMHSAPDTPGVPRPPIQISDNSIVIGNAPPVAISQVGQMSPQMSGFYIDHLSGISQSSSWKSSIQPSIPILFALQKLGLFVLCKVTAIIPYGRAVVELKNHLRISIHTLISYPKEKAQQVFDYLSRLKPVESSITLDKAIKTFCVSKLRHRFEFQRQESVDWFRNVTSSLALPEQRILQRIFSQNLQPYEQDRLYTANCSMSTLYVPCLKQVVAFSAFMEAKSVSEMVSYCEFAVQRYNEGKTKLDMQYAANKHSLPPGKSKTDWKNEESFKSVFDGPGAMQRLKADFQQQVMLATNHDMVGVLGVNENLGDAELLHVMRTNRIKFASAASAGYHLCKHPTNPPSACVDRANEIIRFEPHSAKPTMTLTQDGDGRLISFDNAKGTCIALEKAGRVFICTSMPKSS